MSETEMNYMAKFSLDTSELTKGLTDSALRFEIMRVAADQAFKDIKAVFDSTVGKFATWGSEIQTQANIMGESTDSVQRLRRAALETNTDFSAATQAIKMFSQRVGESGAAGDTLRKKISDMGVSLKDVDGNTRPMISVFMELNAKMGAMEDVTQRNNMALSLYGRSWQNTANMIVNGTKAAEAFAATDPVSDNQIARAEALKIKFDMLDASLSKSGRTIGESLVPAAEEWSNIASDILKEGAPLANLFGGLNQLLVASAQGFRILAIEAKYAWELARNPMDAVGIAKRKDAEINGYVANEKRKSALEEQGYIEGSDQTFNAATGKWELNNKASGGGGSGSDTSSTSGSTSGSDSKAAAKAKEAARAEAIISWNERAVADAGIPGTTVGNFLKDDQGMIMKDRQGHAMINYDYRAPQVDQNGNVVDTTGMDFSGKNDYRTGLLNQVGSIFTYASQNKDQSYQSSNFLENIRSIRGSAEGMGGLGGSTWMNTSESSNIIRQVLSEWNSYQNEASGSKGFTQINYIQGDNAQQVANQIAEATSRAMARKVSS